MAFVYRSQKQSYFDQTAISSLKNDVTNLTNYLGQDQSELFTEDCIKQASVDKLNSKKPIKGLCFQYNNSIIQNHHSNILCQQDLSNIVLKADYTPKENLQNNNYVKSNTIYSKKGHNNKFPHAFQSKNPQSLKNIIASELKQFLEDQKFRKVYENQKNNYSRDKLLRKSKDSSHHYQNRDSEEAMKQFKNQKIRESSKEKASIHQHHHLKNIQFNKENISKPVNKNIKKILSQQHLIGSIPSIPSKKNQFGYVLSEINQGLSLPKLVSEMKYSGDKQNMPGPCDYQVKGNKRVKGTLNIDKCRKETIHLKNNSQLIDTLKSQTSTAPQKPKRIAKIPRTQNQLNQIKKIQDIKYEQGYYSSQDQSDQSEYLQNATPGPGYYNITAQCNTQFRTKKQQLNKIFYSNEPRFLKNDVSYQEITTVKKQEDFSPKRMNQGFLFRAQRKFGQNQNQSVSPPPGFYNDRRTLEHCMVSKLMKSSNSKTFISKDKRFKSYENRFMPGPGQYDIQNNMKFQEQLDSLTSAFKSNFERSIFKVQKQKKRTLPAKQSILHALKDSVIQQQQPKRPGFFSQSPRFIDPKSNYSNNIGIKTIQERVVKVSPKKHPFNSSQKKKGYDKVGEGVGVGSYQLFDENKWNKKSYNVLYN